MTYQLGRVRLANIGDRAARFPDITIDLTADIVDGADPLDSILWLRNGGGKSSLLSLFFALVLPLRRDFLGVSVKRYLEDYIAGGDTAHTVAEWADVRTDTLLPGTGHRLITGAVYEWDERRKPVDADRNRDKLKVAYYAFTAVPGVLTLDTLPLSDEHGRPTDRASFVKQLRNLAAEHPQQLQLAITDKPTEWMTVLEGRQIDPSLFRYQKRMNHSEGGVAELFNFDTPGKFIDLLIDLTVDSSQPERVADNLHKVADILAAKPKHRLAADFCTTLAARLDTLAGDHEAHTGAVTATAAVLADAGSLAGSLAAAADQHAARHRQLADSVPQLEEAQADAVRRRSRLTATANELLLRAARFKLADAEQAVADREADTGTATAHVRAWEAVEPLADHAAASEQIRQLRIQLAEHERESAPLRQRRDRAALALRARLATLEAAERAQHATATARAETAEAQARDLRGEQTAKSTEQAVAAAARAGLEQRITAAHDAVRAAADTGDLPDADTDPAQHAQTVAEHQDRARGELDAVRAARAARVNERARIGDTRRHVAVARAERDSERAGHDRELTALEQRVAAVADHPRLHELLQLEPGSHVDLWDDPATLRAALTRAAGDADAAVVNARVDAAEDVRALDALTGTGFAPTTRDAARVADTLTSAGVTARPGWELLRDLVPDTDRSRALAVPLAAALASGVVVADADLDRARELLAALEVTAAAHVPVSRARDLQAAVTGADTGAVWSFAAPADALYDPAAADTDRTARERRRATRETEIAAWAAQARTDRALFADLDKLLRDCPAGHLPALHRDRDQAVADIAEMDEQLAALRDAAADLEHAEQADAAREGELTGQLTALAGQLTRLAALAEQVSNLGQWRADSDTYAETVAALTIEIGQLDQAAAEQERIRTEQLAVAAEHRATAGRYADDAAAVTVLDDDDAVADDDPEPLSVLRARFDQADRDWAHVASNSVLAERLHAQTDRQAAAQQRLNALTAEIRAAAEQLLGTPDGQDRSRRIAALAAARGELERTQGERATARALRDEAEREVRAAEGVRERERRAVELEIEPVDETHARELAAHAAAEGTEASERATALAKELTDAQGAAAEADGDAKLFTQRAQRLHDAIRATANTAGFDLPAAAGGGGAFTGSHDDADTAVTDALTAMNERTGELADLARRVERATAAVRRAAADPRFAPIEDPLKERFTTDEPTQLAAMAAARATDLRARQLQIEGLLEDIAKDQTLVVTQVAQLVGDVLTTLAAAQRHSKLPGSLGEWSNQQFLTIRFTKPASDEDLRSRISSVIDQIVAEGSKPEGLALVKRCVHEVVAPRGFKVTVLKPNSDLAVEPLDITLLGKYSGGEKLTVCVALYCTLARLRAVNRGAGHLGGTLVLDNPLGTASHVKLLRLQRDVAAAHGVQLVYTTGVEDLGAVGQFPNVVRLRNSPGTLRHRRYVTVESRTGADDPEAADAGITGVRVTADAQTTP